MGSSSTRLGSWPDLCEPARQPPLASARSRYYIRVMAEDNPGVLAKIAAILGQRKICISSVLQHEPHGDDESGGVPVVITTYAALEGAAAKALDEVDALDEVKARSVRIGIVDEHEEQLS